MQRLKSKPLSPDVAAARQRVERWRATKRRGHAMPEELWTEAVSLADDLGAYRIARDLGVSYETLRNRMERKAAAGAVLATGPAGFVEVQGAELLEAGVPFGAVVELLDSDGAQLTMRLADSGGFDVLSLAAAFWGRGR